MKIAITDANIFIDLIKLELLDYLFKIKVAIHTGTAIANELNTYQFFVLSKYIENSMLVLHDLNENDLITISERNVSKNLSPQDISVIYLATKINATVLTGDKLIKKMCVAQNIEAKGILWLLDSFVQHDLILSAVAIQKLDLLIAINDRLPRKDCEEIKAIWLSQ